MAETACQEQEPQVGYWRERARLLSEENEWLRTERDALTAKVTELEEQLEAAKEALVDLARELRHPSERSGKAEGAGEDEAPTAPPPAQEQGRVLPSAGGASAVVPRGTGGGATSTSRPKR